jgi:aminopeptidase N
MKYLLVFLFASFATVAQQTDAVDFTKISATIAPVTASKSIMGSVQVSFIAKKKTDSVYLDAIKMTLSETDFKQGNVSVTDDKIWFTGPFQKGNVYTASFHYEAVPKQTLYFTGNQIWTQGQGKYTSHWLPSIDDMNDKIEFDLNISAHSGIVVSNGKLTSAIEIGEKKLYSFDMQQPMASYLVAFAIGDFQKKELTSKSGIPIELYLSAEDTAKFEPTYRYTKEIFDFLEAEIGVAYPWQNYKQVPVRDFLYAGMENTSCTIFSEAFVVDETGFNDRNYVNVNAHELAHQWFGNLVTETSGTHHWLQEGFATYYALLAEREIFGEDYYYWKLYQSAEQLKTLSDEGKGQSLLDPKASSLIFYEKGAWALHMLREQIGEEAFKNAVSSYLKKYKFKNVATEDFVAQIKAVTGTDISAWEKDWLQQTAFKAEQAFNSLLKSAFINTYFEVARLAGIPLAEKKIPLITALTFPDDYIGQEAISQLSGAPLQLTIPLYRKGFESNNLFVRQAIALRIAEVPIALKPEFESLLSDASYVTQEAALYTLCLNFPKDAARHLDKMDGVIGFQDKNMRQLWLALAILKQDYRPDATKNYTDELLGYTDPEFSFQIRQKAFEYSNQLGLYTETVLKNLVNASVHHNWRFRSASRALLDTVLRNPETKEALVQNINSFSTAEKEYLSRIFNNE